MGVATERFEVSVGALDAGRLPAGLLSALAGLSGHAWVRLPGFLAATLFAAPGPDQLRDALPFSASGWTVDASRVLSVSVAPSEVSVSADWSPLSALVRPVRFVLSSDAHLRCVERVVLSNSFGEELEAFFALPAAQVRVAEALTGVSPGVNFEADRAAGRVRPIRMNHVGSDLDVALLELSAARFADLSPAAQEVAAGLASSWTGDMGGLLDAAAAVAAAG